MAASVRTFSRAHPSSDPGYLLVLDRLDGTITRIQELAKQQEGGYAARHSAAVRRNELRRRLQMGLLKHLVTTAEDIGSDIAAVREMFRIPDWNATHIAFRTSISEMLNQARAHHQLLLRHGLSATLVNELDVAVKEFDASLQETDDGKQSHVAARAEMKTLGREIMRLVGMLDGFNRSRFHRDPELIVAWKSAKHMVAEPQPKEARQTGPMANDLEPAA